MNNEGVVRVWCMMCNFNFLKFFVKIIMVNNYNFLDCIFIVIDICYFLDIMKILFFGFGSNLRGMFF